MVGDTAHKQKVIPLCCLPSLHWILTALDNGVIIDIHENYIKQSFRNRFEILSVNGRLSLTIPVEGQKGQKIAVSEIRLFGDKWRREIWNALKSAYGRSAYFEYYSEGLGDLILGRQSTLLEFNLSALEYITTTLTLPIRAKMSEHNLDKSSTELYQFSDDLFEPGYVHPQLPSYLQVFSDRLPFESNLSVIDLMMNRGPASLEYLLFIKNSEYISDNGSDKANFV